MSKRILHYLILSVVLFGTPLLCCLIGGYDSVLEAAKQFPPRTEDWGLHPENLWNFRRPFHWGWFIGMCTFTFVCMFPLVRRGFKALKDAGAKAKERKCAAFPWWGWLGIVLLLVSWIIAWNRFECFKSCQAHISYFPIWMGYIVTINAICKWRSGHCPMTSHPWLYVATFPASSLFWWFFEYLNRFVWNWYYLGIGDFSATEYIIFATLCFATVLPGVYATAELLGTFRFFNDHHYDDMGKVDVRSPMSRCVLLFLSAIGLSGIVFFPEYAYPLLWISPLMVFVLVQIVLGERCILDRLRTGAWGLVFRFEIAALICGLCWETWNYYAVAKWVYAVPWVHGWQIWEMPLIGFAGYLPFGVECAAVTQWIYGHNDI